MVARLKHTSLHHRLIQAGAIGAACSLQASAAFAQALNGDGAVLQAISRDSTIMVLGGLTALGLGAAIFKLSSARKRQTLQTNTIASLEAQLSTAEILLNAEPHLLYVWRSQAPQPDVVNGDMRGLCEVPETQQQRADFSTWLDAQSGGIL